MCGGAKTTDASKAIDAELQKHKKQMVHEYKLLLLGSGESGKSTIAKQMQIIHHTDHPFTDKEVADYIPCIHHNVINSMDAVLEFMEKKEMALAGGEASIEAAKLVREANNANNIVLTPELAKHIKQLHKSDEAVAKALTMTNEFQFPETALYFFTEVDRVAAADFKPTMKDILSARRRTTGIKEMIFTADGITYRMIDVGGQRSERKKWFHCFDDVTAILFIVAISEYNMVLFEDDKVNRMHDALALFGEICNSKWFVNSSMILFLNKKDLFEEKIQQVDLQVCFPNYKGGKVYKEAIEYIKRQFIKQCKNQEKPIYTHPTCAMDTENIKVVFAAVKDTIQQQIMRM